MRKKHRKTDLLNLIGLARRAGKLEVGRSAVLNTIKQERAKLVILTEDASKKISREIELLAKEIKVLKFSHKDKLGEMLGRKEIAVLAICDTQFAQAVTNLFKNLNYGYKSKVN